MTQTVSSTITSADTTKGDKIVIAENENDADLTRTASDTEADSKDIQIPSVTMKMLLIVTIINYTWNL